MGGLLIMRYSFEWCFDGLFQSYTERPRLVALEHAD